MVEVLLYRACSAGDPGSIPSMGAVCMELVRSPHNHVGFLRDLWFLPHFKDVQVCRLIGFGLSTLYKCKLSLVCVGLC